MTYASAKSGSCFLLSCHTEGSDAWCWFCCSCKGLRECLFTRGNPSFTEQFWSGNYRAAVCPLTRKLQLPYTELSLNYVPVGKGLHSTKGAYHPLHLVPHSSRKAHNTSWLDPGHWPLLGHGHWRPKVTHSASPFSSPSLLQVQGSAKLNPR